MMVYIKFPIQNSKHPKKLVYLWWYIAVCITKADMVKCKENKYIHNISLCFLLNYLTHSNKKGNSSPQILPPTFIIHS